MMPSGARTLPFLVLIYMILFPFFTNSTQLQHFHSHRKLNSRERYSSSVSDRSIELGSNLSDIPLKRPDIDIASVIDKLVFNFTQSDPKFNASSEALSALLASANKLKDAFSSPSTGPWTQKRTNNGTASHPALVTPSELERARATVAQALKEASKRNEKRLKHPRLNHSYTRRNKALPVDNDLFVINSTVANAAAIVAEADAMAALGNGTLNHNSGHANEKRAASFWMEDINHNGYWPFGPDRANSYPVFRNVKDPLFGAVGDGLHDDTAAIQKAISYGTRCGENCGSSSVKGAIVYFPAGIYLISSSVEMYYNTQLIGNANAHPTLVAAPSFIGLGLISSDKYDGSKGGDGEWYINQSNFLRQVRNFIIDVSKANLFDCAGIHWQVAQATSIQDVTFIQSKASDKGHMGIFAENGSGGFMSDLTFKGGAIGIKCGNQQFTTRNFRFEGSKIAIDLLWDWGWTWKSLYVEGADIAIRFIQEYRGGSTFVLDSKFVNTAWGIAVNSPKGETDNEQFSINLDNLVLENVPYAVVDTTAGTILPGGSRTVSSWALGKVYDATNNNGKFQHGISVADNRPEVQSLYGGPNGGYFERSKPQYAELGAADFLSVKLVAKGDGSNDDSVAINLSLQLAKFLERPLYFPAGSYVIKDTVNIPPGSRIVGECWAQIVAQGTKFEDMNNPYVAVRVGSKGDTGSMEIQDMMFTAKGPTAGVVLMEWNIASTTVGSAAMWDSHFRLGGAAGTNLQASDCPKNSGTVKASCIAGSMMLHMTTSSTGYIENVWVWVADHDLDSGPAQTQIDIYVARGILIESTGPSWFYGTASEHAMLYQYQISGAKNIFMGMIQTESPYFAPAVTAPTPFKSTIGIFDNDPDFLECSATSPKCFAPWGVRIIDSTNICIAGAGLYNWFYNAYSQSCVDTQDCQQKAVNIERSSSIWLYNLYTIGTVEMLNAGSSTVLAKANTNTNQHPFTSLVTAWLGASAYDPNDFDEEETPDAAYPPCIGSYDSIDAVLTDIVNIPIYCREEFLLSAQAQALDTALSKYTSILGTGYDRKFQIYATHVASLVPIQLLDYLSRYLPASGFFTCKERVYKKCCICSPYWGCGSGVCDPKCTPGYEWVDSKCPSHIPKPEDQALINAFAYTCIDKAGFDADISKRYGISGDWVVFGAYTARIHAGCWMQPSPGCAAAQNTVWTGFPMVGTVTVENPKTAIQPILENRATFQTQMTGQALWSASWLSSAQTSEIVDGATLPIYMTATAVDSMDSIIEIADKITEQERKEMILNFVSAIFMLIPGVGGLLDAAVLAGLRRMLLLIGDLGNAALAIYDSVNNPEGAAFAIFGLLLGGSASASSFGKAAARRRGMTSTERNTLPDNVKLELGKIDQVRTACIRL